MAPYCGKGLRASESEHWEDLRTHLSGIESSDEASRIRTLNSLSAFLLCVTAANDTASWEPNYGVTLVLESKRVLLSREDVLQLYNSLFKEFAKLSGFLHPDLWFKLDPDQLELPDDAYAETLRCCIRIIPVVDMFNTSSSHSASMAVTDMLHQLRSLPTSSPVPCNMRHIALRTTLLEVFLNEILLHQDLTCPFLQDGDELDKMLTNGNRNYAFNRHYQAPIEAAFAHMLHHHLLKGQPSVTHRQVQATKLSLPAGVVLLDISTITQVPSNFLTHVMLLVAGALMPSSYFQDRSVASSDLENGSGICRIEAEHVTDPDDLPPGMAIGLAASVVETAMELLSKHYSASIQVNLRDKAASRSNYSTVTFSCSSGVTGDDYIRHGPLLPALLRAIACAVVRIMREVSKIKHSLSGSGTDNCELLSLDLVIKRVMESVAGAFAFNMPSVKCLEVIGCFDHCMIETLASANSGGAIGWTLVFFAHILHYESQRGLEDVLETEYLRVLDSLVGLLFLENDCRLQGGLADFPNVPQLAGNVFTNFPLDTVMKPLQRVVWDLHSHKKPVTNLLAFISKLSRVPDPLNASLPEEKSATVKAEDDEASSVDAQNSAVEAPSTTMVPMNPRPSTLLIVKRLQKRQRLCESKQVERFEETRKRTRSSTKEQAMALEKPADNPFITEMMALDEYEESFDDLNDFIVCKKGRDYAKFYSMRIKYRRKNHTRLIWKRREEKKQLLLLLSGKAN